MSVPVGQIAKVAEALLRSAVYTDSTLSRNAKLFKPIPIFNESGSINSWFVALLLDGKIAGFFQFTEGAELIRYAGFSRPELYPDAGLWVDPLIILDKAKKLAGPDDILAEPILSFDTIPSRIAWVVKVINRPSKTIYITGDFAYVKEKSEHT